MNRRSFGCAALYAGALLVGTLVGVASVQPVHARTPIASQQEDESSPSQAPNKKQPPPTPCKKTKECPKDYVCTPAGEQKVCTPTVIKPPKAPMVT